MDQVSSGGIEAAAPSFNDLLTPDPSPGPDPQTTSEPDAATAAQSTEGEAVARQTAQEPENDRSPFIPRQRFDEVNTKLREAKEWRDQYAWAEGLQPQHVQTMREWFGQASADPRAFALNLIDELAQSPQHAAQIRSELARRLGTRAVNPQSQQQAAPQANAITPDVVITDANGNEVGRTYSDKQLSQLLEQAKQQALTDVDARYADKFSALDKFQHREQAAQAEQAAQQFASSFVSELAQLPMFEDHKAAIAQYLQTHPPKSDSQADVEANAFRAYRAVVGPKLAAPQSSQTVLADLQRKAHASSGVNPGAASSASPKSPSNFFDKALTWG